MSCDATCVAPSNILLDRSLSPRVKGDLGLKL